MSDQPAPSYEDDNNLELSDGPGHCLSVARQARGLAINDVASELHLKASVITALEHDRYEELPGPVFVTGYMRSYARLLDMDPEPLVEALRAVGPLREPTRPRVRRAGEAQVGSGRLVMRLVSIAVTAVVAGLAFVWWQNQRPSPYLGLASPKSAAEEVAELPRVSEPPQVSEPAAPALSDKPAEQVQAPEPAAVLETAPTAEAPREDTEINTGPATPAFADDQEQPPPDQAATPEEEPPAGEAPPAGGEIVMEFNGPSWVDIRDSERKYKLFGEMKKGDRHVLGGEPPYSVIIGNASAVRIYVADAPLDLSAIAKGNVARFTLDPDNLP